MGFTDIIGFFAIFVTEIIGVFRDTAITDVQGCRASITSGARERNVSAYVGPWGVRLCTNDKMSRR